MESKQNFDDVKELAVLEGMDGMVEANILKAKLESFGIPCMLKFESVGRIYGFILGGLRAVRVMVPTGYFQQAVDIMEEDDHADQGEQYPVNK